MSARDMGELVHRYRTTLGLTQGTAAHLLSQELGRKITQGLVSELERGNRWGSDTDLPGAFVKTLHIPVEEMMAAQGYPTKKGPRPTTIEDVVKADQTLTRSARRHLLNQYHLLQLASQAERQGQQVIEDAPTSKKRETG